MKLYLAYIPLLYLSLPQNAKPILVFFSKLYPFPFLISNSSSKVLFLSQISYLSPQSKLKTLEKLFFFSPPCFLPCSSTSTNICYSNLLQYRTCYSNQTQLLQYRIHKQTNQTRLHTELVFSP